MIYHYMTMQDTQLLGLDWGVLEAQLRPEQWFRANRPVLNDGKSQRLVFGLGWRRPEECQIFGNKP